MCSGQMFCSRNLGYQSVCIPGHFVHGVDHGIFSVGGIAQLQAGGGSHLWNKLCRNFKTMTRCRHVRREINKGEVGVWNELYI